MWLKTQLGAQVNILSSPYLLVELHKRTSQLVRFSCAGPQRLASQAMLENWLQICWVDSLQLLPVWIAKDRGKEGAKQMGLRVRFRRRPTENQSEMKVDAGDTKYNRNACTFICSCRLFGNVNVMHKLRLHHTYSMVQIRTIDEKRDVSEWLPTAPPVDMEATTCMFSRLTHSKFSS